MEEMTLDPLIRQSARHIAGGRRRDEKIVHQAHLASKRRTRVAIRDSRSKSFGIREEHRIAWQLFEGLQSWLEWDDNEDNEDNAVLDCPTYAWPIKTSSYLDYIWRIADKFAISFEVVRAGCNLSFTTWEQTKMMAMFLRCLRFALSGYPLSQESSLW